jgi:uncharacterized protein YecE (DUF72 family)
MSRLRIGTAGWAIPRHVAASFPSEGSGLQRYAARFDAAEINSTFYRAHRASTLLRWRETTPPEFRFAAKLARAITHDARLAVGRQQIAAVAAELEPLGEKLGPLLIQLPPSLAFDPAVATAFFATLRDIVPGALVCEPRHPSWFDADADRRLADLHVARAAADPARHPSAGSPGGWAGLAYWRLHGAPRMYFSSYDEPALQALARDLAAHPAPEVWCMFDNTTSGAAAANALRLRVLVGA